MSTSDVSEETNSGDSPAQGERSIDATRLIRAGVAMLAGVLVFGAVSSGLLHWLELIQIPLLVGACVGVLASRQLDAAVAGAVAAGVGLILLVPGSIASVAPAVRWLLTAWLVLASGSIGFATAWWCRSRRDADWRRIVAFGAIVVLVANLWVTVLTFATTPAADGSTFVSYLSRVPAAGEPLSDDAFFLRTMWLMQSGTGYYQAYTQAFRENPLWGSNPPNVRSYRMPTLFWIWRTLPNKPLGLFVGLLASFTLAVGAAAWLVSTRLHLALAVPSSALLSAYLLKLGTGMTVLATEPWAIGLALLAIAATAASFSDSRWRTFVVLGAASALAAMLVRETMGFIALAGLISAAFSARRERWFRLAAWTAVLAVFVVAYGAHYAAVRPLLSNREAISYAGRGLQGLVLGLEYASQLMGGLWVSALCAVLALVGSAIAPRLDRKLFMLGCVGGSLLALALFYNGSSTAGGVAENYWGMLAVPVAIAASPWAAAAFKRAGWTRRDVSTTD